MIDTCPSAQTMMAINSHNNKTSDMASCTTSAETISLSLDDSNSSSSSTLCRVVRFADESCNQIIVLPEEEDVLLLVEEAAPWGDCEIPFPMEAARSSTASSVSQAKLLAQCRNQNRTLAERCRRLGFQHLLRHTFAFASTTAEDEAAIQHQLNQFCQMPERYCGRGLERQICRRHDEQRRDFKSTCIQDVLAEENRLRFCPIGQNSLFQREPRPEYDHEVWSKVSRVSRYASRSARQWARRMGKADEMAVQQLDAEEEEEEHEDSSILEQVQALIRDIQQQQEQQTRKQPKNARRKRHSDGSASTSALSCDGSDSWIRSFEQQVRKNQAKVVEGVIVVPPQRLLQQRLVPRSDVLLLASCLLLLLRLLLACEGVVAVVAAKA